MTRRAVAAAVAATLVLTAGARAQLVPLARCHAAYPCNLPYGLRPADAVANLPDAQLGNTLIGVGVDGQFRLRVLAPPVSPDFSAAAARLYVKQHPLAPAASPTPAAKTDPAPATAKPESAP